MPKPATTFCLAIMAGLLPAPPASRAADPLTQPATWEVPSPASVRAELERWLAAQPLDDQLRRRVQALWPNGSPLPSGCGLLERVADTAALVDPQAKALVELCRRPPAGSPPPLSGVWSSERAPAIARNNLCLLYGRWLAQHAFYDEALEALKGLQPADVVDPASLLFYRGVACHHLLRKEECLACVQRLLENESLIPRRYATLARLMEADLRPLKPDSLDEVSRLMADIRRRLGLGHAGQRVRKQEDDVIAKLDKMIEELETAQKQGAASGAGSSRSTQPAKDSIPLGGSGPGDVDAKPVGSKSGWGNLPPKDREEALQQIAKDLPAHFRELIEAYFQRLAQDGSK